MPWMRFHETHIHTPADRRTSVRYKGGCRYLVKASWAPAILATGKAYLIRSPTRAELARGEWPEELAAPAPDGEGG